jgi:hypothetical protein
MMEQTFDKTAIETIDLLESRLQRIEYATGDTTSLNTTNKDTAAKRVADLEYSLHQLASKSRVLQDILRLRQSRSSFSIDFY